MKKIGIWTARVGLLGIFFWCSSLFATWLCYRHTPIEVQSGTMIWVAALIGLQILLYLSFLDGKEAAHGVAGGSVPWDCPHAYLGSAGDD